MTFSFTRKKIIITAAVIVVLGGLLFAFHGPLFILLGITKTTGESIAQAPKGTLTSMQQEVITKVSTDASTVFYGGGGVDAAISVYDKTIQTTNDGVVVSQLLFSKGLLLLNGEKFSQALDVGKSLEQTAPSNDSAMLVGEAYAKLGDKTQAMTYYKIAIQRVKSLPNDTQGTDTRTKETNSTPLVSNTQLGYEKRLKDLQQ